MINYAGFVVWLREFSSLSATDVRFLLAELALVLGRFEG